MVGLAATGPDDTLSDTTPNGLRADRAMSSPLLYVGLDVGGTTMKAAVVDDAGKAFPSATLPTEASRGQEHGLNQMAATIRQAKRRIGVIRRFDRVSFL